MCIYQSFIASYDILFALFDMNSFFNYLTSGAGDKKWGLYLTVCGKYSAEPGTSYPKIDHPTGYYFNWENGRTLDEYQLVFITDGFGQFESDQEVTTIDPGSLMILQPGIKHRYRPDLNTGWTEYYVGFKGSLSEHFFSQTFEGYESKSVIQCGDQLEILGSYQKIFDLASEQKPLYHRIASGLILKMLGDVKSQQMQESIVGTDTIKMINNAKSYMWENVAEDVDFTRFSQENHISYSYFRKVFKQYTGIAPHQFFLDLKIMRAKELIATTNKPIKEITYDIGLDSIHYFSRLFKKKTGLSPSKMRNR